jgi:hypothetical protein
MVPIELIAPDQVDAAAIPALLLDFPLLGELHRQELMGLMSLEENTIKVASELIRGAPAGESLYFAARQTFDDARHLEAFCRRLDATLAASQVEAGSRHAILPSILRAYFDTCLGSARRGTHLEALMRLNIAFKSMALVFYRFAARYWLWLDPCLAECLQETAEDEAVHVRRAIQLMRGASGEETRRAMLLELAAEVMASLPDAFRSHIASFVSRFGTAMRRHREPFADAEFVHGRLLLRVPEDEQIAFIHARCVEALTGALAQAGLRL